MSIATVMTCHSPHAGVATALVSLVGAVALVVSAVVVVKGLQAWTTVGQGCVCVSLAWTPEYENRNLAAL